MDTFNDKLSGWLVAQRAFFSNENIQEDMLYLPERLGDMIKGEDLELVEEMCKQYLRLSFIIAKHSKELTQLVEYLEA